MFIVLSCVAQRMLTLLLKCTHERSQWWIKERFADPAKPSLRTRSVLLSFFGEFRPFLPRAVYSEFHENVCLVSQNVFDTFLCSQNQKTIMAILYSWFRASWLCINEIQQDATVCRYLFTACLLYMFWASIAPIIRSTKTVTAASGTGHIM